MRRRRLSRSSCGTSIRKGLTAARAMEVSAWVIVVSFRIHLMLTRPARRAAPFFDDMRGELRRLASVHVLHHGDRFSRDEHDLARVERRRWLALDLIL